MSMEAQHPDQLQPGHTVGPWRIVERGGVGGTSRIFKVERDGRFFALKVALQSVSPEEESVSEALALGMGREAAALFTAIPQPNLVRVYAVDCWWPTSGCGYPFLVTDWVEGDDWHTWRWRTNPHAAALVDTFSEVVRTVGELHSRGVYHRDLKAENILIRREDGRPFLIDFGTVRLPGTFARTLGIPPGVMHLLPPELLAYARSEAWKEGVLFQGGVGADLYALGAILYQSLCDLHPFNPKLSDNALTAAIATVLPKAPHLLNPRAPRALSDIALRLLEKEPEARYPNTGALLQALWEAGKERKSSAWKAPLLSSQEEVPAESTLEQKEAWLERRHEAMLTDRKEQPQEDAPAPEARRTWRVWHFAGVGLLLLGFLLAATWLVRDTLAPPPSAEPIASTAIEPVTSEKGSSSVSAPTTSQDPSSTVHGGSRFGWLALWLCATTGLGCPAAQVRPEPVDCPEEARRDMFEVLKLDGTPFGILIDVRQPGRPEEVGTYSDGPVVGRVEKVAGNPPELPTGTLLYGRLWTDPGVQTQDGEDAVMGRYTEVLLPNGRKFQVCMALGGPSGRKRKLPGSRSGAVRLYKVELVSPVRRWP